MSNRKRKRKDYAASLLATVEDLDEMRALLVPSKRKVYVARMLAAVEDLDEVIDDLKNGDLQLSFLQRLELMSVLDEYALFVGRMLADEACFLSDQISEQGVTSLRKLAFG